MITSLGFNLVMIDLFWNSEFGCAWDFVYIYRLIITGAVDGFFQYTQLCSWIQDCNIVGVL